MPSCGRDLPSSSLLTGDHCVSFCISKLAKFCSVLWTFWYRWNITVCKLTIIPSPLCGGGLSGVISDPCQFQRLEMLKTSGTDFWQFLGAYPGLDTLPLAPAYSDLICSLSCPPLTGIQNSVPWLVSAHRKTSMNTRHLATFKSKAEDWGLVVKLSHPMAPCSLSHPPSAYSNPQDCRRNSKFFSPCYVTLACKCMHQTLARCPEGKASSLFRRQLELYRTKPFLQPVGSIEFPSASLLCVRHCSGASEVRLLISVQRKLMGEKGCPPERGVLPSLPSWKPKGRKSWCSAFSKAKTPGAGRVLAHTGHLQNTHWMNAFVTNWRCRGFEWGRMVWVGFILLPTPSDVSKGMRDLEHLGHNHVSE